MFAKFVPTTHHSHGIDVGITYSHGIEVKITYSHGIDVSITYAIFLLNISRNINHKKYVIFGSKDSTNM